MKNKDLDKIMTNMADAGCGSADIEKVRSLFEAGLYDEIVKCMRRCRCELMEELHMRQRMVDRMDQLIRTAENSI